MAPVGKRLAAALLLAFTNIAAAALLPRQLGGTGFGNGFGSGGNPYGSPTGGAGGGSSGTGTDTGTSTGTSTTTGTTYTPTGNPYNSGSGSGSNPFNTNRYDPTTFFNNQLGSNGRPEGAYPLSYTAADAAKLASINFDTAAQARIAHAALASAAFVFFFPVGGILVRILPGRLAAIGHFLFQLFGYLLFLAATGLGIWIALDVKLSQFDLVCLHPIFRVNTNAI
jgi:hypothetical protein